MRNWLLHTLFFVAAFAACMSVITKALAETVEIRAVAVCKDGKCVMAEEDYKKLQAFVKETKAAIEHNNQIEGGVNEMVEALRSQVARCKADQHLHIGEKG